MEFLKIYLGSMWMVLPILVGGSMVLFPRILNSAQWVRVIGVAVILMQTFAMYSSVMVDRKTLDVELSTNEYARKYVEKQLAFERLIHSHK